MTADPEYHERKNGRLGGNRAAATRRSVLGLGAKLSLLMACGREAEAAPQTREVIHQLGWLKTVQFGGDFAALDRGFFTEEHVDAEFLSGGPNTDGAMRVATGSVTTADDDIGGMILARAVGMPIKAFAAVLQKSPAAILSLSSKPIRTIGDLEGRTIAAPNLARSQIAALMTRAGKDPLSVTYVPAGTDPGSLAAGQVDGYFGFVTDQAETLRQRDVAIDVAMMADLGMPGYGTVVFASEATLAQREAVLVDWLKAEIRGWHWFLDNPDDVARLVVDKYGQRGLDLATQLVKARGYAPFITTTDAQAPGLLWVEPSVFHETIEFLVEARSLSPGQISTDDVVTQRLIRAAYDLP